ncbi:hypothetical protein ACTP13_21335 [Paenibacillus peoriae]|uniref:hypothetical protein n=1 Tax=Paenibacillus peoriae TaxID=59893 RepID=UPI003F9643BC
MLAQALIQQRFYVSTDRRFYEYNIVTAFRFLAAILYAAYDWLRLRTCRQTIRPWPWLGMLCREPSGFACCAHVLRCARIRWLKASLLEPARSREGSGLFAAQIRQPSRERGLR